MVAIEPELDVALVKIGDDKDKVEDLPYFDVVEAAKRPVAEPGTGSWRSATSSRSPRATSRCRCSAA